MSIKAVEGFHTYNDSGDISQSGWSINSGTITLLADPGAEFSACDAVKVIDASPASSMDTFTISVTVLVNDGDSNVNAMKFAVTTEDGTDVIIFRFSDTDFIVRAGNDSGDLLSFQHNGQVHTVEVMVTDDGSNCSYKIRVDHGEVVNGTGLSVGNVPVTKLHVDIDSGTKFRLFSYVAASGVNEKGIGAYSILPAVPESDNDVSYSPSTGSDNYACVNIHDDSTYNTGTETNKDLFDMSNISVPAGMEVRAVSTKFRAKSGDTDTDKDFIPVMVVGGAEHKLPNRRINTGFAEYEDIQETSPATGGKWTEAEINALVAGYIFENVV